MDERPPRSRYAAPPGRSQQGEPALTPLATPVPAASFATAEPKPEKPEKPKKKGRRQAVVSSARTHWWKILLVVIIVFGIAFFVQNYLHTRNQLKKLSDAKTSAQASDQELIKQVSPYVVLPEGETPTVATVNDVSKLKDQVFFQNAQNGDKVLIFSQAKTAILYRPSSKKIVEYAPINVDASAGGSTGTTTPTTSTQKKQ